MSKYIKLNDALQYALRDSFTDKHITGRRKVTDIIRHLLEASTIEIVHCKDCKHWSHRIIGYCNYWNRGMAEAEDFCSYGERKEEGGAE